jgi:TRAP-type C4-dicarboxylate transport system substrate-binding protein
MLKRASGLTVAAAGFLLAFGTADAQQVVTLSVASWAGPNHAISAVGLKAWAQELEKKTNGTLKLDISFPPVNPAVMYDRVREGVSDISWSFNGYTAGRFVAYQIVEMPGIGAGAEGSSAAYWRTHEKYLSKLNEYKGVRLISLFAQPPSVMHTRKKIASIDDMKGLKIRAGGGVQGDVATTLGMVPVQAPVSQAYPMLKDGVVDGTFFPTETALSFKLNEVTTSQLGFRDGLFGGAYFVIMNPDKFKSLSPAHQKAIDETSGEWLARTIGKAWDGAEKAAIAQLQSSFAWAPDDLNKAVMTRLKPIEDKFLGELKAKGVDAAEAIAFLRAEAKKAAAP